MTWPKDKKQKSRKIIIQSAVKLFSSRGFERVSINDVMKNAKLTHGGFYSHFNSKQELYAEAVLEAAQKSIVTKFPKTDEVNEPLLSQLLSNYLDISHVRQEQEPCPLAFLVTDVSNGEDRVRAAYTKVYKRLVAYINKVLPIEISSRREKALSLTAIMIGGVAISRALNDEKTAKSLLKACQKSVNEMIST